MASTRRWRRTAGQKSKLARNLIIDAARQAESREEFIRVIAGVVLTSFHMMQKRYHLSPAASVEWVEVAVQDAIEQFAKLEGCL